MAGSQQQYKQGYMQSDMDLFLSSAFRAAALSMLNFCPKSKRLWVSWAASSLFPMQVLPTSQPWPGCPLSLNLSHSLAQGANSLPLKPGSG